MDLMKMTAARLTELLAERGVTAPAKAAKRKLIALLEATPEPTAHQRDKIRARKARDLRVVPVMLVEHAGTSRFYRRHRIETWTGLDGQRSQRLRTIKKPSRRAATNVPATRRDLMAARRELLAS